LARDGFWVEFEKECARVEAEEERAREPGREAGEKIPGAFEE